MSSDARRYLEGAPALGIAGAVLLVATGRRVAGLPPATAGLALVAAGFATAGAASLHRNDHTRGAGYWLGALGFGVTAFEGTWLAHRVVSVVGPGLLVAAGVALFVSTDWSPVNLDALRPD